MIRPLIIHCMVLMVAITIPAMAQDRDLLIAINGHEDLTFCGEPVPMKLPEVRERFEKEMLLSLQDRAQAILWIKRASRYMPFIEDSLKSAKMPADLKYIAIAESALRPHAGSPKGAMGFWQLMQETAQKYGLTVDTFLDQRRDIYLSTPAALAYLDKLHEQFGSWTLSAAGYNMGEEGLTAEILAQKTNDYYQLYLPLETQRFVFRVLAAKLILSHPEQYGLYVKPEERYQPLAFDTIGVDCYQDTPIQLVAQAAGTYFKMIKDLNPHLRGHYLRTGHIRIRLPQGSTVGFKDRLDKMMAEYQADQENRIYIVNEGDSLSAIAERFDVPLAAILIWNRIGMNSPIHPGDRLVIPPGSGNEKKHDQQQ